MDSEEVLILSVENSAECLCLGKRKVDKGKCAADPTKKHFKKACRGSKPRDNCLVIVDGGSGSEDDYIEVYGGKKDKTCMAHVDSAGDKDVLKCVVDDLKELDLSTLNGDAILQGAAAVVTSNRDRGDVRMKRSKPSMPLTVTDPNQASVVPDSLTAVGSDDSGYLSTSASRQSTWPTQPVTTSETNMNRAAAALPIDQPKLSSNSGAQIHRTPTCWTNCPNCPPNKKRKYHLIDVAYNSPEWGVVSIPLTQAGFDVNRVQRIQNESLWERLCFEKQLMLRDRQDVNEQLLYHTSRSSIPVICDEGLDLRLSRNGMFGSGIYFR